MVGYGYGRISIGKERGIAIALIVTNPFQNDFHRSGGRSYGNLSIFVFDGWLIHTRVSLALVDCIFYGPVEVRLSTFIRLQIALQKAAGPGLEVFAIASDKVALKPSAFRFEPAEHRVDSKVFADLC